MPDARCLPPDAPHLPHYNPLVLRFRRRQPEPAIDLVPLIDVVFLVLTFFLYAMLLMVPAKVLPVRLAAVAPGAGAEPAPAVTLTIDRTGSVFLDREPIAVDDVLPRLREAVRTKPETVVYIAVEETGSTDRLPTFMSLYERLYRAGLDLRLVGRPAPE